MSATLVSQKASLRKWVWQIAFLTHNCTWKDVTFSSVRKARKAECFFHKHSSFSGRGRFHRADVVEVEHPRAIASMTLTLPQLSSRPPTAHRSRVFITFLCLGVCSYKTNKVFYRDPSKQGRVLWLTDHCHTARNGWGGWSERQGSVLLGRQPLRWTDRSTEGSIRARLDFFDNLGRWTCGALIS